MAHQTEDSSGAPAFTKLINLASARLGSAAIHANDDFFAEKENLVKDSVPIFVADKYTDRGKWMDGWESKRRRVPGNDFCIVKLGLSGAIRGVDIDTSFFLGNHPPHAKLTGLSCDIDTSVEDLWQQEWRELVPQSALKPGSHNYFAVSSEDRWTHLRLDIFPDGGVARLRIFGDVRPHWPSLMGKKGVDLVAVENGGRVLGCNDMFFSSKDNLIMPGRGVNMGDGWETKRRREPGHDWAVLKLGRAGRIDSIVLDTAHFKGNYPDRAGIEACSAPDATDADVLGGKCEWVSIVKETKLRADFEHILKDELHAPNPVTHVRLNIHPDGGVSRLRVFGQFV